jgi:general secretion pathway protein K
MSCRAPLRRGAHVGVRHAGKRRGVALLVVLWAVALLATLTAVASTAARQSADVTAARRAGSIARAMAESGLVLAAARVDNGLRAAGSDSTARGAFLDGLEPGAVRRALAADTLGDGVFAVSVVDVSARLDVNSAGREGWYLLLRQFTGDADARTIAGRIDAAVRGIDRQSGQRTDNDAPASARDAADVRDSLVAELLGREVPRPRGRIETVDDLLAIPGIDPALLGRIAPLLTVDGNGSVNRRAAPAPVIAAASGSLVDHPGRLLLVSRGWMRGHPLTREIEAVYDVTGNELRLVRWRERDR